VYPRILELVYRRAASAGDASQVLEQLEAIAASVFRTAPAVYGFRPSPLWEVEKAQYVEVLRRTILALEESSSGWTPVHFEEKFGIQGTPTLQIRLEAEVIHLHGVIDRVDQNARGQMRVVDYKTGGSNLTNADLKSGRRLQMPIYALAAQEALNLGEVVEGFYWKIRDAEASSFKLSKFKTGDEEGPAAAYSVLIAHIARILDGIRSGQFPPRPPKGGCPPYCPAVQWCWRYQAGF